jgi:hypothetical protein
MRHVNPKKYFQLTSSPISLFVEMRHRSALVAELRRLEWSVALPAGPRRERRCEPALLRSIGVSNMQLFKVLKKLKLSHVKVMMFGMKMAPTTFVKQVAVHAQEGSPMHIDLSTITEYPNGIPVARVTPGFTYGILGEEEHGSTAFRLSAANVQRLGVGGAVSSGAWSYSSGLVHTIKTATRFQHERYTTTMTHNRMIRLVGKLRDVAGQMSKLLRLRRVKKIMSMHRIEITWTLKKFTNDSLKQLLDNGFADLSILGNIGLHFHVNTIPFQDYNDRLELVESILGRTRW